MDVNILRLPESDRSVPCCFDTNPAHHHLVGSPLKDLLKLLQKLSCATIHGSAGAPAEAAHVMLRFEGPISLISCINVEVE